MNLVQVHRCGNSNCLSQQQPQSIDPRLIFTRTVYQVDATILCQFIKQIQTKHLSKTFAQLLYLASRSQLDFDRPICPVSLCEYQQRTLLLLTNVPDLISVAINWNFSQCTTSDVEDLVSTIDPFVYLRELFDDVTTSDARIKQLNLIGLICFYGGTVEVFFSFDQQTSKWLFCFDGNIVVSADWNAVQRKCIEFHLQPFLLIYANPDRDPVDISQLLKRTMIQTEHSNVAPDQRRLEQTIVSKNNLSPPTMTRQADDYQAEHLRKISSFATLNSSMLFMPKPAVQPAYINQETVVKVMQQQFLKKDPSSSDTTSISSSSTSSPLVHVRHRTCPITQPSEDALSSEGSSASSQRDSGLSSDGSPRDSLSDNEQTIIDGLIKQTEHLMTDDHLETSYSTIEHYFEESLKFERTNNYSSALESCQQALLLVEQILQLSHHHHHQQQQDGISIYARTKKNSLLLRIRALQKRQSNEQEHHRRAISSSTNSFTSTFKPSVEKTVKKSEVIYDNNLSRTTSILACNSRHSRPKKNVKFSDHVALIVPTTDDVEEPPSEHLIHSFLRQIHQREQPSLSDSDSETTSSPNDLPIGLSECTLCHKRCSKTNQIGTYCSNCHFYMQRFQPTT